jgi:hypothetical protein
VNTLISSVQRGFSHSRRMILVTAVDGYRSLGG